MTNGSVQSGPIIDPSKYLADLIARANGATVALQTANTWLLALGAVLAGIAMSTTDDALLVAQPISVPQIGVSIPVTVTFAFGPFIFLSGYLYILTLRRGAERLRRNVAEEMAAQEFLEADRGRLLRLLVSTPFLSVDQPQAESAVFGLKPLLEFVVQVVIPLIVLLILEISAIRYQSLVLTYAQQIAIIVFLLVVLWDRHDRRDQRWSKAMTRRCALAGAIIALLFVWCSVPSSNDWALTSMRKNEAADVSSPPFATCAGGVSGVALCVARFVADPLDSICQSINWGCRYMVLYGRILEAPEQKGWAATASKGIDLHERRLRFADLDSATLIDADLTNADLSGSLMNGANLSGVNLESTNLDHAQLNGAVISCSQAKSKPVIRAGYISRTVPGQEGHSVSDEECVLGKTH